MSNHFHIVLKLCSLQAAKGSGADVVERWLSLFKGPLMIQQRQAGKPIGQAQLDTVSDTIKIYRERLASLSGFMKCLKNPLPA